MRQKSQHILKSLVEGQSWKQILAEDETLTQNDMFHAVSEAPTAYWRKPKPSGEEAEPMDAHRTVHKGKEK